MRKLSKGMALAALVAMATPTAGEAQPGPRGERAGPPMDRGGGVEMVLRLRDRLELTADQVTRLDAIRNEVVERRNAHQAQMEVLRSKVRSGELSREEFMEVARAHREGSQGIRDETRARVDEILTPEQRQEVEVERARAEGFAKGRAGARQGEGPGARGSRGGDRGGRGMAGRGCQGRPDGPRPGRAGPGG